MPVGPPDDTQDVTDAGRGSFRAWVLQDWAVNRERIDAQLILAWLRLVQWAMRHWGPLRRPFVAAHVFLSAFVLRCELPATAVIGPRLRLYHTNGIVLSPHTRLGADCEIRHGVTVGNTTDRDGRERGVATVGSFVDLGAGCAVLGPIHVGDHARIGALAVVTKDVEPWAVVVGNPGRVLRVERPTE
jgi:putative colanic acid biosynthesis acetyltransferase WcaB